MRVTRWRARRQRIGHERPRIQLTGNGNYAFVLLGSTDTALDRATGAAKWTHAFGFPPVGIFASHDTLVAFNHDTIVGFPFAARSPTPPRR